MATEVGEEAKVAAAEMAAVRSSKVADWIKSGTPETEPVTTETPVEVKPVVVAPVVADATAQVESLKAQVAEAEAVNTAAEQAAAGNEDKPKTFKLVGRVGEEMQEIELPEGFEFQLDKDQFAPLKEVRNRGLREADYTRKTQETARTKKELTQLGDDLRIAQARLKARDNALTEKEAQLRQVLNDPDQAERIRQHQERIRTDPIYKEQVEDAEKANVLQTELDTRNQLDEDRLNKEAADFVVDTAARLAKSEEFAGVDQQRVLATYVQDLEAGRLKAVSEDGIRQLFVSEKEALGRATAPLQTQIQELTEQLSKLTKSADVETHNADTRQKIARQLVPGQPVGGEAKVVAGELPPIEPGQFQTREQLGDRVKAWTKLS